MRFRAPFELIHSFGMGRAFFSGGLVVPMVLEDALDQLECLGVGGGRKDGERWWSSGLFRPFRMYWPSIVDSKLKVPPQSHFHALVQVDLLEQD